MDSLASTFKGHVEGDRLEEAEQALKGKLKVRGWVNIDPGSAPNTGAFRSPTLVIFQSSPLIRPAHTAHAAGHLEYVLNLYSSHACARSPLFLRCFVSSFL